MKIVYDVSFSNCTLGNYEGLLIYLGTTGVVVNSSNCYRSSNGFYFLNFALSGEFEIINRIKDYFSIFDNLVKFEKMEVY